jgi:CRP-like cAMP-binding protein
MKNISEVLKSPLFDGIAQEEVEPLLKCLFAFNKSYGKGQAVFFSGEKAVYAGIVLRGEVQIVKEDFLGNRAIIANVLPGELFGEVFSLAKTQSLPVGAVAAQECEILFFDCAKILNVCASVCGYHMRLLENLVKILVSKNLVLNQKIGVLSKRGTREKLIEYLSDQARIWGKNKFVIPFDRQELADYLCVDRSAMSAEISKMQKEGILRTQKSRFELL